MAQKYICSMDWNLRQKLARTPNPIGVYCVSKKYYRDLAQDPEASQYQSEIRPMLHTKYTKIIGKLR